jgi:GGDEF domain-containing protein
VTLDVLVIALAALVASNVVLLVAATRSGAAGRASREVRRVDRPAISPDRIEWAGLPIGQPDMGASRTRPPLPTSVAAATVPVEAEPRAGAAAGNRPDPAVVAPPAPPATAALDAPLEPSLEPPLEPAPATSPVRRSRARADARRTGGRRGRRFTLPSIEVDHERTERVVLSLLTGDDEIALAADAADEGDAVGGHMVDAWERLVGSDDAGESARAAVVVALTLDGLDRLTEVAGRDGADRAIGGALDAIRRSARGSDRVASVGRGHFRVLLVDADEAVAARFVARVRETLERRPALASTSVALAAGWAEAHTAGHLEGAVHAAEERRRNEVDPRARRSGDGSPA